MNPHDPPIEIQGVTRQFANKRALDNVSLTVPRGVVFGLVGENRAGKTTLIKCLIKMNVQNTSGTNKGIEAAVLVIAMATVGLVLQGHPAIAQPSIPEIPVPDSLMSSVAPDTSVSADSSTRADTLMPADTVVPPE